MTDNHPLQPVEAVLGGVTAELREALQVLEDACEAMASCRSLRTYDSILEDGGADTLIALDNARRGARAAIRRAGASAVRPASAESPCPQCGSVLHGVS